jgi:hypothetical protein
MKNSDGEKRKQESNQSFSSDFCDDDVMDSTAAATFLMDELEGECMVRQCRLSVRPSLWPVAHRSEHKRELTSFASFIHPSIRFKVSSKLNHSAEPISILS